MYNGVYNFDSRKNLDTINRQIDDLNNMKNQLQNMLQPPINNIINTQPQNANLFEMKILNENEEAENVFINTNTIFLGSDKMQIKKIDGTVEKYEIKKYYPIEKQEKKIEELEKEIQELKEMLKNNVKHSNDFESVSNEYKSSTNGFDNVEPATKTVSKQLPKSTK